MNIKIYPYLNFNSTKALGQSRNQLELITHSSYTEKISPYSMNNISEHIVQPIQIKSLIENDDDDVSGTF